MNMRVSIAAFLLLMALAQVCSAAEHSGVANHDPRKDDSVEEPKKHHYPEKGENYPKKGEHEPEDSKKGEHEPEDTKKGEHEPEDSKKGEQKPEDSKKGEHEPEDSKKGEHEPEDSKKGEHEPKDSKKGEHEPESSPVVWKSCRTTTDDFEVSEVTISPNPPVIGSDIAVAVNGTLHRNVTGGKVAVLIKYGSITIIHERLDLCAVVDATEYHCPLSAGPLDVSLSERIPSLAPAGAYTGHVVITDQNEHQLACVDLEVEMSHALNGKKDPKTKAGGKTLGKLGEENSAITATSTNAATLFVGTVVVMALA